MRPRLQFIMDQERPPRRAFGIDDYAQPLLAEVTRQPNSVWVTVEFGDRPGLKIGDVAPSFPPKMNARRPFPSRSVTAPMQRFRKPRRSTPCTEATPSGSPSRSAASTSAIWDSAEQYAHSSTRSPTHSAATSTDPARCGFETCASPGIPVSSTRSRSASGRWSRPPRRTYSAHASTHVRGPDGR